MAFGISTPDIPNYLTRIRQIQQVIVPKSATMLTPSSGAGNYPYWLTMANSVTQTKVNEATNVLTISVDMLLIRGGALDGYDGQVEMAIMQDLANTVSYFKRHTNLCTTEYPSIQNYFYPDSATITQAIRWEGSVQGGQAIIGSLYTLQFRHKLQKTNDDISTP